MKKKLLSILLITVIMLSPAFTTVSKAADTTQANNKKYVFFDGTNINNDYKVLDADLCKLYISMNKVENVSDGYKLYFLIGNPQYCDYIGYTINLDCNYSMQNTSVENIAKTLITKDYEFPKNTLSKGSWNYVDVTVPVKDIKQLEYIAFSIDLNTVSLFDPHATVSNGTTTTPVSIPDTKQSVIESRIDGEFNGFDNDKIFKLQNGQIWQQTSYTYWYYYKYSPKVLIYKSGTTYKMKVDGVNQEITVKQLK